MASFVKGSENTSPDAVQEESNASIEAPSSNSPTKEESVSEEKEDNSSNPNPNKTVDNKTSTISNVPETKSTIVKINRGAKRLKLDGDATDKKENKDEADAEAKTTRSLKRSCELWSLEDKNTFFKAINEYGKDFDALQTYFLVQGKKKGVEEKMIKNKEQIRHFYYRTWLKISKHLKFSEDVKKTTQELYGLINYGELRRKLPRMHEKFLLKLNELLYYGSTQVRLRGKTMRIKTPICRALRKINQLEGWQEDIKLPSRVTLELRPGNNISWWHVQALSMNPRVRTLVPIQRRLSSILSFLQYRWRPWRRKNSLEAEDIPSTDNKDTKLLRVAPPERCKITLPVVNLGEYLTSNSVSLNSYENRLGLKSSKDVLLGAAQSVKNLGKKGLKKPKGDKKLNIKLDDVPDSSDIDQVDASTTEKITASTSTEKTSVEQPVNSGGFPGRETIDRIRLGWNIEDANTITVGDLFLMFGRDSKIVLEYWWEATPTLEISSEKETIESPKETGLTLALQKLLSIARHSYGTSKAYDNVSGSSETVISSRIPSTKESVFRRPLIPQTYHKMGAPEAFKTQLDKYRTRFCRRGRIIRQRNLVAQRILPVTPETMMQQHIQHHHHHQEPIILPQVHTIPVGDQSISVTVLPMNENGLQSTSAPVTNADETQKNFLGVLDPTDNANSTAKVTNSGSSITSAMQILKEGEQGWLNSEVADFSLSSFLGQLESPVKGLHRSQADVPMIEIIRPNSDVANMQGIMNENSVDYTDKFANFASQIVNEEKKSN